MEEIFTNIEKAGIVFAMMGPELTEVILNKLPKEIVSKIQLEILPIIDEVQMPPDIDSFVLTEIIQNKKILSASTTKVESANPKLSEEDIGQEPEIEPISVQEEKKYNWLTISEEELFENAPIDLIIPLIIKENNIFRSLVLDYFNENRKKELKQELTARSIILTADMNKSNFVVKMEKEIRKKFASSLRSECSKPIE
ncbi:MAG: hypothetical protein A2Y40_04065 [Candidatus Margulisbacteria bacterium GWF2_35_9]|nr:MAG: hypothetical protein A2Y40_04065 [Candidatus Margulisbacteria bacterium GWF2_35_9]